MRTQRDRRLTVYAMTIRRDCGSPERRVFGVTLRRSVPVVASQAYWPRH